MAELIFEIGVEDLPALAIEPALKYMASFLSSKLTQHQLKHDAIEVHGTPRRLIVTCSNIQTCTPDVEEEILGPNVKIAFDERGALSKAGLGFLRSKGLHEQEIFKKETAKGQVIAAVKKIPGQATKNILPELLQSMMHTIPFKKKMRWDSSNASFSRPIVWLLSLFDGAHLPVRFANINSATTSRGHRFMNPAPFEVCDIAQYQRELRERFVIISPQERERMFTERAQTRLKEIGAVFQADPELMATVKNLFEFPYVIVGKFDEKYLKVPDEILVCEMKAHQKCFAVRDSHDKLLPYFVCSAGVKPYDESVFEKGNARVLHARFEDGAFYYELDRKKSLKEHGEQLASLVFERELGSVSEKVQRIEKNAREIAQHIQADRQTVEQISVAAPIIKADLASGVVGEFPELQGVMGRIYANQEHYYETICGAIESHYWPRFSDDAVPPSLLAGLLSIGDKLDTIVGICAIGKKPHGNKDPFALRRSAIGVVRILLHFGIRIEIKQLVTIAIKSFGDRFLSKGQTLVDEIDEFILQRARQYLIDDLAKSNKEHSVQFAESVLAVDSVDVLDVFARAHALYSMRQSSPDEFETVVQTFKRASNIVTKAESNNKIKKLDDHIRKLLTEPVERDLMHAIEKSQETIAKFKKSSGALKEAQKNYEAIFSEVRGLKPKLDAFFESVMVMVEDPQLRNARLSLLANIKNIAEHIGDFTHL